MRLTRARWASKVATAPAAPSSAARSDRGKELQTWLHAQPRRDGPPPPRHDFKRQDIVSPELCREAVEILRPTLPAPGTCHVIDLNPGLCLWSQALNDALQPRSHILVEQEDRIYQKALSPLLNLSNGSYHLSSPAVDTPAVKMNLPWDKSFFPGMNAPRQPVSQEVSKMHTDHLILTVNLARKNAKVGAHVIPYRKLFLNEFHRGIAQQSDYFDLHKYGLVRLLAWLPDAEKSSIMPRSFTQRNRLSRQMEASCHIRELVSSIPNHGVASQKRPWYGAEFQNRQAVAHRHPTHAIDIPPHRVMPDTEPPSAFYRPLPENFDKLLLLQNRPPLVQQYIDTWGSAKPGPSFTGRRRAPGRPHNGLRDPKLKSLSILDNRMRTAHTRYHLVNDLAKEQVDMERELLEFRKANPDDLESYHARIDEFRPRLVEINAAIAPKFKDTTCAFLKAVDDYRCNLHEVLPWHTRQHEPLCCYPDQDFYPHQPMTLLEFTPKLSFATKINTSERHICFAYLDGLFDFKHYATLQDVLEHLVGHKEGYAYSEFLSKLPQLTDPLCGGHHDLSDFRMRTVKMDLIVDIAVAYESWPYRKSISEMLSATGLWKRRNQ